MNYYENMLNNIYNLCKSKGKLNSSHPMAEGKSEIWKYSFKPSEDGPNIELSYVSSPYETYVEVKNTDKQIAYQANATGLQKVITTLKRSSSTFEDETRFKELISQFL